MTTPFSLQLTVATNLPISADSRAILVAEIEKSLRNATNQAPVTVTPAVLTETDVITSDASVAEDDPITFTATITAADESEVAEGSVVFSSDEDGVIGAASVVAGEAELVFAALSVGAHVITADFVGTVNYAASTDSVAQEVTA